MQLTKSILGNRYQIKRQAALKLTSKARDALSDFKNRIENGNLLLLRYDQCELCGEKTGIQISEIDRLGVPCKVAICKNCGLVMNDSFMDTKTAAFFYNDYWGRIQWQDSPENNFKKRTSPQAYTWKRHAYMSLNLKEEMKELNNVVEIGCGDGCNLLPFHLEGKRVIGCDLDESYLAVGRKQGLNLILGDSDSIKQEFASQADLIILSHVFEHFTNLDNRIETIKKILKPGGYVYVEVPGILTNCPWKYRRSIDGYETTNNFLSYLQFQHNFNFDLLRLRMFWERNDFNLISGDEWIRSIFRWNPDNIENTIPEKKIIDDLNGNNVFNYIKDVENDFNTIRNTCGRVIRKIRKMAI